MSNVTRAFGKAALTLKKHLPTILTLGSAACTVASVVFAIKETRKVDDILEEHKKNIETLHEVHDNPDQYLEEGEAYSEEDYKKDLVITYTKTGVKLLKLYWPCIVTGISSIGCGFASHGMMKHRNAALMASYAVVSNGWNEYRQRVAEKFGEEVEKQIFSGEEEYEEVESYTDNKGKEKTKVTKHKVYKPSGYARIFDSTNPNWSDKNYDYNMDFLRGVLRYSNDRLKSRGYLTLAEVYEDLGYEATGESLLVGWIYDPKGNVDGDNKVTFGLDLNPTHNFDNDLHDHNASILLDFNVDGVIYDRLPTTLGFRNGD